MTELWYHMRLTIKQESEDELAKYLDKYCSATCFGVLENSKNGGLHYHVIFTSKCKPNALREAIKSTFRTSGNGSYSLSKVKGSCERASQYMAKGYEGPYKPSMPTVVVNNLWSDDDIKRLHEQYYIENKKTKKAQLENKNKKLEIFKLARDHFFPKEPFKGPEFNLRSYIKFIMDNIRDTEYQMPDPCTIRRNFGTLVNKYVDSSIAFPYFYDQICLYRRTDERPDYWTIL